MGWQKFTIERTKLYEEVWNEPMTKVAKVYGLSDVGLRKICVKLEVPCPPRGYWAQLAAGKKIKRTPLRASNVSPTFTRTVQVAEKNEALECALGQARLTMPCLSLNDDALAYLAPSNPAQFQAEAKLVVCAMKRVKAVNGAITSHGATWADLSVSAEALDRALLLVDRFATTLKAMGGHFDNSNPSRPEVTKLPSRGDSKVRNCFELHGQKYVLRIQERIEQELIPPPAPRAHSVASLTRRVAEPVFTFRRPEYRYVPTGKLFLAVVSVVSYYDYQKTQDTPASQIEAKLLKLLRRLEEQSLRSKLEQDIAQQRELDRRRKSEEWERRRARKDALLNRLAAFEKMARDLDRAESLRRLGARMRNSASASVELAADLAQLSLMANWLDPLIEAAWPEVDEVPEKNPHESRW